MNLGVGFYRKQNNKDSGSKLKKKNVYYSCGCTIISCDLDMDIEAYCLKCGNIFSLFQEENNKTKTKAKASKNNKEKKSSKSDEKTLELVPNNLEDGGNNLSNTGCLDCKDKGWIKVFTQEWDRIKCHHAPCPKCHPEDWDKWSLNRWIIQEDESK